MQRRAKWHNYRSRHIYMITLVKSPSTPALAVLSHPAPGRYCSSLLDAGIIVASLLSRINDIHPALRVWGRMIMPDHVHFILYASEPLPLHIGHYIGELKKFCSLRLQHTGEEDELLPFFLPGFHDRILTDSGQLGRMKHYIADNPRRAWLKREYRDLFVKMHRVKAGEEEFEAVGNIFLLDDFDKRAVVAHSRYSHDEMTAYRRGWEDTADNGGVLVSPFIHPLEKGARDYAMAGSGRIIEIRLNGFGPRFKPEGRLFDLCAEGRLLLLAPLSFSPARIRLSKALARRMNAAAEAIAAGDWRLL